MQENNEKVENNGDPAMVSLFKLNFLLNLIVDYVASWIENSLNLPDDPTTFHTG